MTAPVDVGTHWLINISTDSRQTLGKFAVSNLTTGNALMVKTT
ncbi:MAG: hypothetical protein AAF572_22330 [Cyanobacteria bacterium P01_B01_bin.77]